MAQEAEVSTRTVDAHLSALRGLGLISEYAPPRQHRPRTWRLEIGEIAELVPDDQLSKVLKQKGNEGLARFISRRSDAPPVANPGAADRKRAATLNRADAADPQITKPDPQFSDADSQLANPESQNSRSGSQLVAPERYNGTKNGLLNYENVLDSVSGEEKPIPDLTRIRAIARQHPELSGQMLIDTVGMDCWRQGIDFTEEAVIMAVMPESSDH